jgi:hypothetical protein
MRIYKTRQFNKWAVKQCLTDLVLLAAVDEIERGLIDADLGGHVVKKRVALPGRGKSAGARTLLAYRTGDCAFFVYGFAKNERDSIDEHELKGLRQLALIMFGWTPEQIAYALHEGRLLEVKPEGSDVNHV